MDSKRKMIISITIFAVAILAVVITIVSVLAAQNVTVNSSINVHYTSSQKAAKVTAKYQVAGGSLTDLGSIEFEGDETGTDATKDLTGGVKTISGLSDTNNWVEFVFTFTNEGSSEYTATLTLPSTVENFTISYTHASGVGVSSATDTSFVLAGNTTTPVEYKIKFTIGVVADDATLNGDFEWVLS